MARANVAVSIDPKLLREVDRWIKSGDYPNRSRVVQDGLLALRDTRARRRRLLRELAKLDPREERTLADQSLRDEVPWPAR